MTQFIDLGQTHETMRILVIIASLPFICGSIRAAPFPVPTIDLAAEQQRQVIVDREAGQYLGHPTTVLLEDGKTILTVYPKGHGKGGIVYKRSPDGGLTWSAPETVQQDTKVHLCEPGFIRSPDGKEIAVLLRENSRTKNSHILFSRDEGVTFTTPRELPDSLNGDRHTGKYLPDGRLFVSFRSLAPRGKTTPFAGDWVAWVGRYDDLATGQPGQYHVRLMDNTKGSDCAYPGVEVLPDATIVTTTYGHWTTNEAPYIVSVRLKLAELDAKAKTAPKPSAK